jgi:hypothetical protein
MFHGCHMVQRNGSNRNTIQYNKMRKAFMPTVYARKCILLNVSSWTFEYEKWGSSELFDLLEIQCCVYPRRSLCNLQLNLQEFGKAIGRGLDVMSSFLGFSSLLNIMFRVYLPLPKGKGSWRALLSSGHNEVQSSSLSGSLLQCRLYILKQ